MASSYPGALDAFTNPTSTDAMDASAALYHDAQHANANDAIEAVQAELGTDPSGAQATVKARLEATSAQDKVWPAGAWRINAGTGLSTTSSLSMAANTLYLLPFWVSYAATVDRLQIEVVTPQTGANGRLGIYTSKTDGEPDALLLDGGEYDASSAALKTLTVSQALSASSLYWFAILNETASVGVITVTLGNVISLGRSDGSSYGGYGQISAARTYTSGFAATAPAWASYTWASSTPIFWLRRT